MGKQLSFTSILGVKQPPPQYRSPVRLGAQVYSSGPGVGLRSQPHPCFSHGHSCTPQLGGSCFRSNS